MEDLAAILGAAGGSEGGGDSKGSASPRGVQPAGRRSSEAERSSVPPVLRWDPECRELSPRVNMTLCDQDRDAT